MAGETVLYKTEGSTAFITINRPEARNALNAAVFHTLDSILDEVAADESIRAVIVTGAGNAFVSGADINDLLVLDTTNGWSASRFQQSVFNKLERLGKSSIAAINGFALGGGLELALACTFRIASTKSRLGFPEMGLGIIPAFGGTQRIVRTVGYAKASELILFRTIVDASEACRIGLVHELAEPDALLERAREWARDLASLSPLAVRLELEMLLNACGNSLEAGLALESALASVAVASPEAKGLLRAFVDKGNRK